jgi:ATP phosphoribosyltransferase
MSITLAVSKGRILKETLPLLARIGITPVENPESTRNLIIATNRADIKLLVIRATDTPTYVEYGAADLGIAGKDVLLEYPGDGLYDPLDLKIARCRLVLAGLPGVKTKHRWRIATKYTHITKQYFAEQGVQVDIIKLYGSMELAPLVGLADRIVDLVDTGNTLKANGLIELEKIMDVSSRLIVNKAAMKMKAPAVKALMRQFEQAVAD